MVVLAGGCTEKRPDYDRKTPEATLRSFFRALAAGRMPADLEVFFVDDFELQTWRMRCKTKGCTGGTLSQVTIEEAGPYRAVLRADYVVHGERGAKVMRGRGSRIVLALEEGGWTIAELGERVQVRTGPGVRREPTAVLNGDGSGAESRPSGAP
jgi:hypothetical protein